MSSVKKPSELPSRKKSTIHLTATRPGNIMLAWMVKMNSRKVYASLDERSAIMPRNRASAPRNTSAAAV